jgi:secreted trypsin-like serine protease
MQSLVLVVLATVGGLGAKPDDRSRDCVAVGRSEDDWTSSGVLVGPNVVVTAGHAYVDGEENGAITRVFVGDNVRQAARGTTIKVRKAIRHPDFNRIDIKNDLMVLILAADVRNVRPHPIATNVMIESAKTVRVVGYGATVREGPEGFGYRRSFEVPIVSFGANARQYGMHPGLEFVAVDPSQRVDSAAGDGGGPAYLYHGDRWFLAAITSRGILEGKGEVGQGSIYVRLDRYQDWIRQTAADHDGRVD